MSNPDRLTVRALEGLRCTYVEQQRDPAIDCSTEVDLTLTDLRDELVDHLALQLAEQTARSCLLGSVVRCRAELNAFTQQFLLPRRAVETAQRINRVHPAHHEHLAVELLHGLARSFRFQPPHTGADVALVDTIRAWRLTEETTRKRFSAFGSGPYPYRNSQFVDLDGEGDEHFRHQWARYIATARTFYQASSLLYRTSFLEAAAPFIIGQLSPGTCRQLSRLSEVNIVTVIGQAWSDASGSLRFRDPYGDTDVRAVLDASVQDAIEERRTIERTSGDLE